MMKSEQAMMMQPGADKMHVQIMSPASGIKVRANQVTLHVKATGYTLACDWAGKEPKQGIGHYHVLLDKSLINMFCTSTATISMQNVKPGSHTLTVVPAQNDHAEIEHSATSVHFDYEPVRPLPRISGTTASGTPAIKILEPADGSTLSGVFTLKVRITNFNDSCGLLGKPDVPGYGHWHINVDSMTGAMMGMATMLGMSCTQTFTSSTVGFTPGSTHTMFALLTDNGHAPLKIFDKISFKVA